MTPEEHEQYIAQLERDAEQALASWEREQRTSKMVCILFLLGIAAGLLCYFI